MKTIGCELHARQQTIAMVDTETGEVIERTLSHEGNAMREFYASLEPPVVVGIEATGAMQWFLELLEELGIECRVGHPAKIRAAETRKQKHDRRDAHLLLDLLVMKDRFPQIWMPSTEQRDLRTLLRRWRGWRGVRSLETDKIICGCRGRKGCHPELGGLVSAPHTNGARLIVGQQEHR